MCDEPLDPSGSLHTTQTSCKLYATIELYNLLEDAYSRASRLTKHGKHTWLQQHDNKTQKPEHCQLIACLNLPSGGQPSLSSLSLLPGRQAIFGPVKDAGRLSKTRSEHKHTTSGHPDPYPPFLQRLQHQPVSTNQHICICNTNVSAEVHGRIQALFKQGGSSASSNVCANKSEMP